MASITSWTLRISTNDCYVPCPQLGPFVAWRDVAARRGDQENLTSV